MTDQQHILYRMYDVHARLLYVGITLDPAARFRAHAGDKDWWPQVASIGLEHFDTREELVAAETVAILAEDPLYNVASRPPMGPAQPPSGALSVQDARSQFADLIGGVQYGGDPVEITKHGKTSAYLVSPEWFGRARDALGETPAGEAGRG